MKGGNPDKLGDYNTANILHFHTIHVSLEANDNELRLALSPFSLTGRNLSRAVVVLAQNVWGPVRSQPREWVKLTKSLAEKQLMAGRRQQAAGSGWIRR